MDVNGYTPIGIICSGEIYQRIGDTNDFEVSIYESPIDAINGPIQAELIYSPGSFENYKTGTMVKVHITFSFGGVNNDYDSIAPNTKAFILGAFSESAMTYESVKNPITNRSDVFKFTHPKTGAGISTTHKGATTISTGGIVKKTYSPYGFGINKNSTTEMANNMHRVISNNQPFNLTKEHFGMFEGSDSDAEQSSVTPDQTLMNFRRFVTPTKDPSKWTSVCEGACYPFVGGNNNAIEIKNNKDVLFTRISHADLVRHTYEVGETGDGFITSRIDSVILSEMADGIGGATPAVLGNKFKLNISDSGAVNIVAVGAGVPGANIVKFKLSIDDDGNLSINASGKITFTHGDADEALNSIVMDPAAGIDVTASKGFRVNGSPLVQSNFVDMIQQNAAAFTLGAMGPSALGPPIVADMAVKTQIDGALGGYYTTGKMGIPALGVMNDADSFKSI